MLFMAPDKSNDTEAHSRSEKNLVSKPNDKHFFEIERVRGSPFIQQIQRRKTQADEKDKIHHFCASRFQHHRQRYLNRSTTTKSANGKFNGSRDGNRLSNNCSKWTGLLGVLAVVAGISFVAISSLLMMEPLAFSRSGASAGHNCTILHCQKSPSTPALHLDAQWSGGLQLFAAAASSSWPALGWPGINRQVLD